MKIEIVEEVHNHIPELLRGQIYASGDHRFHVVSQVDYAAFVLMDLNGGNRRYSPRSLADLREAMLLDTPMKFRLFTGTLKLTVGVSDD